MAFIPALNTARVEMSQSQEIQKVMNVYHVKNTAAWTEPDLLALATLFDTWWTAEIAPGIAPTITLDRVVARDLTTENGIAVEHTAGLPKPGTGGDGGQLPNNVTLAIKWTTGLAGRSFRGRTYHIGVNNGDLTPDKQHVTTVVATALRGHYANLLTRLDAAGYQLAVASFYHGVDPVTHKPIPRTAAVVTGIIDAGVETTLDSQRRRLPGRGR